MGFINRKNKWDMFRSKSKYYIVRTDTEKTTALILDKNFKPLKAVFLPSSLANGDAYLGQATSTGLMCVKGNKLISSDNIDIDVPSTIKGYDLHKDWQGADHYFQRNYSYYAITGNQMRVSEKNYNMSTAGVATKTFTVFEEAQNALCYLAESHSIYYVTETSDKNGLLIHTVDALHRKPIIHETVELPKSVLTFVPGGLALNYDAQPGFPPFMRFEMLFEHKNGTGKPETPTVNLEWTVGQTEELKRSQEKNWYAEGTVSASYQVSIFSVVARAELSLTAGGGGSEIVTNRETWESSYKLKVSFQPTVEPGQTISYWQGVAGIGDTPLVKGKSIISKSDGVAPEITKELKQDYFTSSPSTNELDIGSSTGGGEL